MSTKISADLGHSNRISNRLDNETLDNVEASARARLASPFPPIPSTLPGTDRARESVRSLVAADELEEVTGPRVGFGLNAGVKRKYIDLTDKDSTIEGPSRAAPRVNAR